MKPLLEFAEEISQGIPSHYHVELEKRLAIVWGDRRRNRFNGKPRSRAEILLVSRENRARIFYLRVQDQNCLLFLPFILAYSPRACVDLKFTEFTEFRKYGRDKIHVDGGTETKKLINTMAIRRGFNQNLNYLRFMETMYPEESQELEPIAETGDPTGMKPVGDEMQINGTEQEEELALAATSTSRTDTPPPNEPQSGPTVTSEISSNDPNFTTAVEQRVIENAPLQGIAKVFDEYMCGTIRRVTVNGDLKAAVTMVFPIWGGPVDCLMSLDICERDVEQLAMALFDAKVKWVERVLHVVLNEGTTLIIPNSEVTLKGVPDVAIFKVFGPEIYDAITECPIRRRELAEGKRVTECVSVILTKNGAIVNLSLGLEKGFQIQDKLYT